jgi:hypothetical protein
MKCKQSVEAAGGGGGVAFLLCCKRPARLVVVLCPTSVMNALHSERECNCIAQL